MMHGGLCVNQQPRPQPAQKAANCFNNPTCVSCSSNCGGNVGQRKGQGSRGRGSGLKGEYLHTRLKKQGQGQGKCPRG
eukprot:119778-Pelagomonas_calceolata.AAC.1